MGKPTAKVDIVDGLSVERSPGSLPGWRVVHVASGLHTGIELRLKVEARELRADLLATGCDWTLPTVRAMAGPAYDASREIMRQWRPRAIESLSTLANGPRMLFCCTRDSAGLIHVQNVLAGMNGQHHVHDEADFARWREPKGSLGPIRDEDLKWTPFERDCDCGLKSGETRNPGY